MNKKSLWSTHRSTLRKAMGVVLAGFGLLLGSAPAPAATPRLPGETDIASTPIVSTTAAQVKPNIMLLMDASGSMGWTHMPDGVETATGVGSVGYKSPQCNVLYYDRNQTYLVPKKADGSSFLPPSFTDAPYAGFVFYYGTKSTDDTSRVNLSSEFRAYDRNTLENPGPVDVAQAAYYYLHSSGTSLNHAVAPCTDPDTGASRSATGGGTWQKVIVSTTSGVAPHVDETQNFAIWYSFYRTRISLIKSAASLAFTPLTDTFRVGFITMQPKNNKNDAAINPDKYLEIGDFNTAQRTAWFEKLFSQAPGGSSPAREALARVGRYYAGKQDSINTGMTITNDPLQYACQQNFTIMTTDGYWNTQTETPDSAGRFGGPLRIDGVTKIGQADGDDPNPADSCPLSDPFCPRPIWDGNAGSTELVKDASNLYDQLACPISLKFKTTFQPEQRRTQFVNAFTKTKKRTLSYRTTTEQFQAQTMSVTKTQTKMRQRTEQFAWVKLFDWEEKFQVWMSQSQSRKVSSQLTATSTQATSRSYQVKKLQTQMVETSVQYRLDQVKWREEHIQRYAEQRQYQQEVQQVYKRVYHHSARSEDSEVREPVQSCVSSATVECKDIEVFPRQLVDPDSCSSSTSTVWPYEITECTPGPMASVGTPVRSCDPAAPPQHSGSPNFLKTICTDVRTQAPSPQASCNQVLDNPTAPFTRTICTFPGPNNFVSADGQSASCTPNPGTTAPFIEVRCTNVLGGAATTYPNSCDPTNPAPTGPPYVTATCTQPGATNYSKKVADCSPGLRPNNQQVTCGPRTVVFAEDFVDPASCTTPPGVPTSIAVGADGVMQTCTVWPDGSATASSALPAFVPVPSCTAVPPTGPAYKKTECDYPSATNYTARGIREGTCDTSKDGSAAAGYQRITCDHSSANNGTTYLPPGVACTDTTGLDDPYIKTTCFRGIETMAPTPADPTTCPSIGTTTTGDAASGYLATLCERKAVPGSGRPVAAASCVRVPASASNNWTETVCTSKRDIETVLSCSPGAARGDGFFCEKLIDDDSAVETCAVAGGRQDPASANGFVRIVCTTQTTFGPQKVAPADCPTATSTNVGNGYEVTTCVQAPDGPYATPTLVDSCIENDPATPMLLTSCSKPAGANNDLTPRAAASCPAGASPVRTLGANHVWTTCTTSDETVFVADAGACNAVKQDPTAGNGYVSITCDTARSRADERHGSCLPSTTGAEPEAVTCTEAETQPWQPGAACTNHTDAATDEFVYCRETPLSGPVADSSCQDGALTSSPYTVTKCTAGTASAGVKRRVRTTLTQATLRKSGSVVVSTVRDADNVGAWVEETECLPATDARVALPSPNPQRPANGTTPAPTGACTAWPCTTTTSVDDGSKNSLADVAQYYYKTDLRPDNALWPNVVQPIGTGPEDDKATHQHMTTFVVGLGVSGTLNYRSDYRSTATTTGDFAKIRCVNPAVAVAGEGCLNWPVWPDPTPNYYLKPDGTLNTDRYNDPKSIDDFWHTAVNGRGTFFSAKDPTSVVTGLGDALTAINVQTASGAGDAVSTFEPVTGNNFVYTTSYQTGSWAGNLEAYTVNPTTGHIETSNRLWSAKDLLDAKTSLACDNRTIWLLRDGASGASLVDLAWDTDTCVAGPVAGAPSGSPRAGTLTAAEKAAFGSAVVTNFSHAPALTDGSSGTLDQRTLAAGANLLNFIRGQRGHEGFVANSTKLYRSRATVLGDLVGSQPVYVGKPFARYQDADYSRFINDNSARVPMVYVGGNDGMLHAFDAASGNEAWAVVPGMVLPNLWKLADNSYKNDHRFYVDGSPVVGDVHSTATGWVTLLVGGLNAGGKGFYALDVTDPGNPRGRWEFQFDSTCGVTGSKGDCDMGLSFGRPVITKLSGRWVVLLTSGYNNVSGGGTGGGFLFVLDALDGTLLQKIATGAGSSSAPSGLGQINAFVENTFVDNTTVKAYGADLLGNIWKFDLSASNAVRIGTAKDASGTPQPITTRPELAEVDNKPMVFVGTGRLLGSTDVGDLQVQSIYGIVDDPTTASALATDLRGSLRPVVMTNPAPGPGAQRTTSCTDASKCARTTGWVVDLPQSGERVNVNMQLNLGTLNAASNVPKPQSCTVGGQSWFNQFDFRTGLPIQNASVIDARQPGLGQRVSSFIADSLTAGFNIYKVQREGYRNGVFSTEAHQVDAGHQNPPEDQPSAALGGNRISWREITP